MIYNIGLLVLTLFHSRSLNVIQRYCFDTHKGTAVKEETFKKRFLGLLVIIEPLGKEIYILANFS